MKCFVWGQTALGYLDKIFSETINAFFVKKKKEKKRLSFA